MAKNLQSSNRSNCICFKQFGFCIAMLFVYGIHQVSGMVDQVKCGTVDYLTILLSNNGTRILNGITTHPAEFPFVAALFRANGLELFCGGTVISNKHVLTAAHCIQGKGSALKLKEADIKVRLGAYNLSAQHEEGVVQSNVIKIHVHEDWKVNEEDYDADIAILELDEFVTFSSFIRPVCLPADNAIVNSALLNVTGVIAGWGRDKNDSHEEILKSAYIRTLNDSYCYRKNIDIVVLSSDRTFCGIGVENVVETPNRGDSGGGFFFDNGDVYEQYGIISSIRTNSTGHVVQKASVYTNVQPFKDWIINKRNEVVLACAYIWDWDGKVYCCWLTFIYLLTDYSANATLTGTHHAGNTTDNVEGFYLDQAFMHFLPNGIGHTFKNLKIYKVNGVTIIALTRSNFRNMENLQQLFFVWCLQLETLDEDSLWDLPNLEIFLLLGSNITMLHEQFFYKNTKLQRIQFSDNLKVDFLPKNLFINNLLLKQVEFYGQPFKTLNGDLFQTNVNLKSVTFSLGKLEFLPDNLFQNNLLLEELDFSTNTCINAVYPKDERVLNDFLHLIRAKCNNSVTP